MLIVQCIVSSTLAYKHANCTKWAFTYYFICHVFLLSCDCFIYLLFLNKGKALVSDIYFSISLDNTKIFWAKYQYLVATFYDF